MSQKAKPSLSLASKKMSRFIVVHGDKGGVGKSFVAQALTNFLVDRKEKVVIIDVDTTNPDVSRMFEDSLTTTQIELRSNQGWMDVVDFVAKYPGHTVIFNTPGGISGSMKTEIASFAKFLADQDSPIEMELMWVMNIQHDSVNLLQKALNEYGQHFKRICVVCNLHFANGDKSQQGPFFLWNESQLRINIEKKNGMTLFFPGLHLRVVSKLMMPGKIMSFSDAANASLGEEVGLETSERWKLQQWLADIKELFTPAFPSVKSDEAEVEVAVVVGA